MSCLTLRACAKINLTLDILRKREDGYHDLAMVMQSISLADTVTLTLGECGGICCTCDQPYVPTDHRNIAVKAALAFFEATGIENPGLKIDLVKRIPSAAGMAGGSSDAAAVLRGLRTLLAPNLENCVLERIGLCAGSDVPYCVRGTTALAEGRGELLTDLPALPHCWIVVCKPDFSLSTPELFSRVQIKKISYHPDNKGMVEALSQGDLKAVACRMFNVFEDILPQKYSEVFAIKNRLLELGALNALMSGSGPTVYGIFCDADAAQHACCVLSETYKNVFLAEPVTQI